MMLLLHSYSSVFVIVLITIAATLLLLSSSLLFVDAIDLTNSFICADGGVFPSNLHVNSESTFSTPGSSSTDIGYLVIEVQPGCQSVKIGDDDHTTSPDKLLGVNNLVIKPVNIPENKFPPNFNLTIQGIRCQPEFSLQQGMPAEIPKNANGDDINIARYCVLIRGEFSDRTNEIENVVIDDDENNNNNNNVAQGAYGVYIENVQMSLPAVATAAAPLPQNFRYDLIFQETTVQSINHYIVRDCGVVFNAFVDSTKFVQVALFRANIHIGGGLDNNEVSAENKTLNRVIMENNNLIVENITAGMIQRVGTIFIAGSIQTISKGGLLLRNNSLIIEYVRETLSSVVGVGSSSNNFFFANVIRSAGIYNVNGGKQQQGGGGVRMTENVIKIGSISDREVNTPNPANNNRIPLITSRAIEVILIMNFIQNISPLINISNNKVTRTDNLVASSAAGRIEMHCFGADSSTPYSSLHLAISIFRATQIAHVSTETSNTAILFENNSIEHLNLYSRIAIPSVVLLNFFTPQTNIVSLQNVSSSYSSSSSSSSSSSNNNNNNNNLVHIKSQRISDVFLEMRKSVVLWNRNLNNYEQFSSCLNNDLPMLSLVSFSSGIKDLRSATTNSAAAEDDETEKTIITNRRNAILIESSIIERIGFGVYPYFKVNDIPSDISPTTQNKASVLRISHTQICGSIMHLTGNFILDNENSVSVDTTAMLLPRDQEDAAADAEVAPQILIVNFFLHGSNYKSLLQTGPGYSIMGTFTDGSFAIRNSRLFLTGITKFNWQLRVVFAEHTRHQIRRFLPSSSSSSISSSNLGYYLENNIISVNKIVPVKFNGQSPLIPQGRSTPLNRKLLQILAFHIFQSYADDLAIDSDPSWSEDTSQGIFTARALTVINSIAAFSSKNLTIELKDQLVYWGDLELIAFQMTGISRVDTLEIDGTKIIVNSNNNNNNDDGTTPSIRYTSSILSASEQLLDRDGKSIVISILNSTDARFSFHTLDNVLLTNSHLEVKSSISVVKEQSAIRIVLFDLAAPVSGVKNDFIIQNSSLLIGGYIQGNHDQISQNNNNNLASASVILAIFSSSDTGVLANIGGKVSFDNTSFFVQGDIIAESIEIRLFHFLTRESNNDNANRFVTSVYDYRNRFDIINEYMNTEKGIFFSGVANITEGFFVTNTYATFAGKLVSMSQFGFSFLRFAYTCVYNIQGRGLVFENNNNNNNNNNKLPRAVLLFSSPEGIRVENDRDISVVFQYRAPLEVFTFSFFFAPTSRIAGISLKSIHTTFQGPLSTNFLGIEVSSLMLSQWSFLRDITNRGLVVDDAALTFEEDVVSDWSIAIEVIKLSDLTFNLHGLTITNCAAVVQKSLIFSLLHSIGDYYVAERQTGYLKPSVFVIIYAGGRSIVARLPSSLKPEPDYYEKASTSELRFGADNFDPENAAYMQLVPNVTLINNTIFVNDIKNYFNFIRVYSFYTPLVANTSVLKHVYAENCSVDAHFSLVSPSFYSDPRNENFFGAENNKELLNFKDRYIMNGFCIAFRFQDVEMLTATVNNCSLNCNRNFQSYVIFAAAAREVSVHYSTMTNNASSGSHLVMGEYSLNKFFVANNPEAQFPNHVVVPTNKITITNSILSQDNIERGGMVYFGFTGKPIPVPAEVANLADILGSSYIFSRVALDPSFKKLEFHLLFNQLRQTTLEPVLQALKFSIFPRTKFASFFIGAPAQHLGKIRMVGCDFQSDELGFFSATELDEWKIGGADSDGDGSEIEEDENERRHEEKYKPMNLKANGLCPTWNGKILTKEILEEKASIKNPGMPLFTSQVPVLGKIEIKSIIAGNCTAPPDEDDEKSNTTNLAAIQQSKSNSLGNRRTRSNTSSISILNDVKEPSSRHDSTLTSVTNGLQGTSAVASALAAGVVAPSLGFGIARQQAMVNFVQNMRDSKCFGVDEKDGAPAADSPTQMSIGESTAKHYVGGAVGNTILALGLLLLVQVLGTLYLKITKSSSWNKPFAVFARCNVSLTFFVCSSILLAPTLTFSLVTATLPSVPIGEKILAIIFGVVIFAVASYYYAFWCLFIRSNNNQEKYRKVPRDGKNKNASKIAKFVTFWFEGKGEWMIPLNAKLEEKLCFDAATPMIEGYNGNAKWFGLFEFVIQLFLALGPFFSNIVPEEKSCTTLFAVLIVTLGAFLFACLYYRPFQEFFNIVMMPVITLCEIIVIGMAYGFGENQPEFILTLTAFVTSAQSVVVIISILANFSPLMKHLVRFYRKLKKNMIIGNSKHNNNKHQQHQRGRTTATTTRFGTLKEMLQFDDETGDAKNLLRTTDNKKTRPSRNNNNNNNSNNNANKHGDREMSLLSRPSSSSVRRDGRENNSNNKLSSSSSRREERNEDASRRRRRETSQRREENSSRNNNRSNSKNDNDDRQQRQERHRQYREDSISSFVPSSSRQSRQRDVDRHEEEKQRHQQRPSSSRSTHHQSREESKIRDEDRVQHRSSSRSRTTRSSVAGDNRDDDDTRRRNPSSSASANASRSSRYRKENDDDDRRHRHQEDDHHRQPRRHRPTMRSTQYQDI